jgi:redox-sensing transcriptional repressor
VTKAKLTDSSENIPKSVVSRLSLYLRELHQLMGEGVKTVSSNKLGRRLGLTDAQVRKDFAWFGQFGYPGVGYRCDVLATEIKKILGTDQHWPVALVGCGNLGQALLGYGGFQRQGFSIELAFDSDPRVIGQVFGGVEVRSMHGFESDVGRHGIHMAILAVPPAAAQVVAERMAAAGVAGILNFAPITLSVPERVGIVSVDLAIKLEQLAFAVVNARRKR